MAGHPVRGNLSPYLTGGASTWTPPVAPGSAVYLGQYRATPAGNTISPAGAYAQITDLSGAGHHYAQATDAKKFVVGTSSTPLGSKDAMLSDGLPRCMRQAAFWYNNPGGYTLAGIISVPSGANTQDLIDECSDSNAVPFVFIQDNAAGGLRINIRNDAGSQTGTANVDIIPSGLLDGTPHLFFITDNGAGQLKGYLDNPTTAVATINYTRGTTTLETSTILSRARAGSEVAHHAGGVFELDVMSGVMDAAWLAARRVVAQASHGTP